MRTRAQKAVIRKAKALATSVQTAVQRHVAARVDGFLQVVADAPPKPAGRHAVREKVERKLKQFHPMD